MKVLVTGANGLLGQHLIERLINEQYAVIAIGRGPARLPFPETAYKYYDVDISVELSVHNVFSIESPEVVIHAAAMTQVDDCELNQELCERINVQGTSHVIINAEQYSRKLIYISTDFVFDGEKGDYAEEDDMGPVNWYGFTKMQAESIVETCDMPWAIVRTCLVYGNVLTGTRTNIINWVKENLSAGKPIKVVSDQVRTPTYVMDLVNGIMLILLQNGEGTFHIAGKDVLTPYDMAMKSAAFFKLDPALMTKVDASTFSQPGRRPLKTGFNISKAKTELGYTPVSFDEALVLMNEERVGK
ncbi:MAG: SDR family oxidoreductase [Chitinophagaceae bacterium]|nr:MAG: SDR family oxidoreductase [Chitinophagaceae bacterium]